VDLSLMTIIAGGRW